MNDSRKKFLLQIFGNDCKKCSHLVCNCLWVFVHFKDYLFHPSLQVPPWRQGLSWHRPRIVWHEDRIDPKIFQIQNNPTINQCKETIALMFFPLLPEFSFTSKFSILNFESGCTCANWESRFMIKVRMEISFNSLIADVMFLDYRQLFAGKYKSKQVL